jgi:hypothetical protein
MNRGFIIYAIGHENYYQMAETLAASLQYNAKLAGHGKVNVAILCDNAGKIINRKLFSIVVNLSESTYLVDGKIVFNNATVCMNELSPFDETIKLDADMIWLNGRDPLKLFEELKAYDIMHMNRGHGWRQGNSVWADEDLLKKRTSLPTMTSCIRSTVSLCTSKRMQRQKSISTLSGRSIESRK